MGGAKHIQMTDWVKTLRPKPLFPQRKKHNTTIGSRLKKHM